jgi:hypothetical protein
VGPRNCLDDSAGQKFSSLHVVHGLRNSLTDTQASEHCSAPAGQLPCSQLTYQLVGFVSPPPTCPSLLLDAQTVSNIRTASVRQKFL